MTGQKLKTGSIMIVIAFLGVVLALPFEWRTPQGALYRRRAERLGVLAAESRAREHRARLKGQLAEAEQSRLRAEQLEQQGWTYRKASYFQWKWPELKPGGDGRIGD